MAQQAFQQQGMGNMAMVGGVPMGIPVAQMNPAQLAALRNARMQQVQQVRFQTLPRVG